MTNNRRRSGEADRTNVVALWKAIYETGRTDRVCDQLVRRRPVPPRLLARIARQQDPPAAYTLTGMQREVLLLAGEGLTTRQSAVRLRLSFYTVQKFRQQIIQRMKTRTLTEAYATAFRMQLLTGTSEWGTGG